MPLDGTLYQDDEILAVLIAAQERIRKPENWCIGDFAQDRSGQRVIFSAPNAVKFCAIGALQAVGEKLFASDARDYLNLAAEEAGYWCAPALNNATDQPTTYVMFSRAIELRQAEIMEVAVA